MNNTLVARIEQVCCLGLDGQVFIPALLRELHACIPCSNYVFHWVDEHLRVANVFSEEQPEMLPRYVGEFLNKREREREAFPGVSQLVAQHPGAFTMQEVAYDSYQRSAFYNEILRPAGYHQMLALAIHEHGRSLGLLVSLRGAKDAAYQSKEKSLLEHLAPFIAHGMHNATPVNYPLVEHPESGFAVLPIDQ